MAWSFGLGGSLFPSSLFVCVLGVTKCGERSLLVATIEGPSEAPMKLACFFEESSSGPIITLDSLSLAEH